VDTATPSPEERRDAFVGRIFESFIAAAELLSIYIGDQLGYYQALAASGGLISSELAARTATDERYAREWLEQQAVSAILDVDDVNALAGARVYRLPAAHAEVLLDRDSLNYLGAFSRFAAGMAAPLPQVLDAYRSGGGVPWEDYGDDVRIGQADQNRPLFLNLLGQEWLPAIPDVHARLREDPPARIADVACGGGWSSIAMARAYPKVRVDGYDVDGPSVDLARANAAEAGLSDRVQFSTRDIADPAITDQYQLITIFEALHDFSQPVQALRAMRGLLADDGALIVMDEKVEETFTAPGSDLERLFYSFSVLC
jgi:SAM-dependent methyltransferase